MKRTREPKKLEKIIIATVLYVGFTAIFIWFLNGLFLDEVSYSYRGHLIAYSGGPKILFCLGGIGLFGLFSLGFTLAGAVKLGLLPKPLGVSSSITTMVIVISLPVSFAAIVFAGIWRQWP